MRQKLVQFISNQSLNLNAEEFKNVAQGIIAYAVGISDAADLKKIARNYNIREEVQQFKNEFLDSSNYITSKFWRAMYAWAKAKGKSPALAAKEFDVSEPDIWFAIDMLSKAQITELKKITEVARYVEHPSAVDLNAIVLELRGVAYNIAKRKLKFISNNDIGTSEDDLAMDLMLEGMRVVNIYDAEDDFKKIRNFAIRAMKNYSIRLIDYYTAKCRQRIVRTKAGGLTKADRSELETLRSKEKRLGKLSEKNQARVELLNEKANTISEYRTTVYSLSYEMAEGFTLASIIEDDAIKRADVQVIESDFVRRLITQAPKPIADVLEVLSGRPHGSFDSWLEDKAISDDSNLIDHACAFFKVTKSAVQEHVSVHLD